MSMTLYVVIALQDVPNTDVLNKSTNELSVPVVLESDIELSEHSGYLPAKLDGKSSGTETYVSSYSEFIEYLPEHDSPSFEEPVVITFKWSGDFQEASVSMYLAYLLSKKSDTIVFEPQSGIFLTAEQLLEGANAMKVFSH